MAVKEQGGFLRGDPPAGGSVGPLAVVGPDGEPISGGGGGGGGGTVTSPSYVRGTDSTAAYDLARDRVGAGSPFAVRLTDGTSFYVAPSSGQLPASLTAGGNLKAAIQESVPLALDATTLAALETVQVGNFPAVQPVNDNGGSLTVDGPLTDAQLRASAVPVSGFPAVQPVSDNGGSLTVDGTVTADVSDRAAREAGRFRIWDGADEATVLPRGTPPSAADKGLVVVPMNVPRPAYQVVTTEITLATTVGVKELLNLWHPSTLTRDVFVLEIGVNLGVHFTAGRMAYELSFTSAAPTGGTAPVPQQLNRADPASGLTVAQVKTGGGTLTGAMIQRATQAPAAAATPQGTNPDGVVVFRAKDLDDYSDAIVLRSGIAEGLNIQANVLAALTGAPILTVYVRWVERA